MLCEHKASGLARSKIALNAETILARLLTDSATLEVEEEDRRQWTHREPEAREEYLVHRLHRFPTPVGYPTSKTPKGGTASFDERISLGHYHRSCLANEHTSGTRPLLPSTSDSCFGHIIEIQQETSFVLWRDITHPYTKIDTHRTVSENCQRRQHDQGAQAHPSPPIVVGRR